MNAAKRDALCLWVKAVNAKGGFGSWSWDVAFKPAEIHDILARHGAGAPGQGAGSVEPRKRVTIVTPALASAPS